MALRVSSRQVAEFISMTSCRESLCAESGRCAVAAYCLAAALCVPQKVFATAAALGCGSMGLRGSASCTTAAQLAESLGKKILPVSNHTRNMLPTRDANITT